MQQQRGNTVVGFILGLVVGLAVALAVAVYVTKVPVPFLFKGQSRSAEQDAAEARKNKDWEPNAPLRSKPVAPPASAASGAAAASASVPTAPATSAPATRAPATEAKPAPPAADPLGDLARLRAGAPGTAASAPEPFVYFVQVGAFRTPEDAEGQRAKLSLNGIETKVSEREQSGRIVYRVRSGPYERREDADRAKARLDATGLDTALVRVQR